MSGEYYILEEIIDPSDSQTNVKVLQGLHDEDKEPVTSRSYRDPKLQEIEQQLELAESRCSCLKNQLDYMKQLYGSKKNDPKTGKCITSSRINNLRKHYENNTTNDNIEKEEHKTNRTTQTKLYEELNVNTQEIIMNLKSNAQNFTDPSVTKLPKLKLDMLEKKRDKTLTVNIPKTTDTNFSTPAVIKHSSKRNVKRVQSSSRSIKKRKFVTSQGKTQGKTQVNVAAKISDLSAHKLVEIYHNKAAKGSDSDEMENGEKKSKPKPKNQNAKLPETVVPPLKINVRNQVENGDKNQTGGQESCQEVTKMYTYANYNVPENECGIYAKNYALPTIASRMKQVAKNYLSSYNFKAIPFCAAISTTPSHNIGINIQQVMNIIKTRQPIQGLSPTLTHNIVLAANKLNCAPLSTFISTITSKADYGVGKHQCPLSKSLLNYNQLEEMAKNVPDEVINEEDEDNGDHDSPEIETNIITGPSGEFQVHNQKRLLWSMETSNKTCTCISQDGLELGQIVTKYQSNNSNYANSRISGASSRHIYRRTVSRNNRIRTDNVQNGKMKTISEHIISNNMTNTAPLQGKERNLKEVLENLHRDFEAMNNKYEEMVAKATENATNHQYARELEKLENELNSKEEEINMVMALYKEVVALKQQVKVLKKETSKSNVASKENISKFKEYNNPKAAFHLTKLLKQIQHYQLHYKKAGCT